MTNISLNLPKEEIDEIVSSLEYLGLNKNEIIIYLDLMKSSKSTALEISKRTEIHRSNTYDSLRNLVKKGFVNEIIGESKKLFVSVDPSKLKRFAKEKEKELMNSIEKLSSESKKSSVKEGLIVGKGAIELRNEIEKLFELGQEILIEGADEKAVEVLTEDFLKKIEKMSKQKKVPVRIIEICDLKKCPKTKFPKSLKIKRLHEKQRKQTLSIICKDCIIHVLYKSPIESIKIYNKAIANSQKANFEILWDSIK
ncbi:MAG: TrmB family transcriptional regulator [Minisyncoccales bacterium]